MFVFIRGLPGVGKTSIANSLAEKLQWKVISIDAFKKQLMNELPNADFVSEIVPASYQKGFEILEKYIDENVIIEEVFRNKEFVEKILIFCQQNNIPFQWFKIIRDKRLLQEVNSERKRTIKNDLEILNMFEEQINRIDIKNEVEIKNTASVEEVVKEIIQNLKF